MTQTDLNDVPGAIAEMTRERALGSRGFAISECPVGIGRRGADGEYRPGTGRAAVFSAVAICERQLTPYPPDVRDALYYCVGARTGVGIRRALRTEPFDQYRAGLHHLCFRARSREDVDAVAAAAAEYGGSIVHPPVEDDWAPGYYSVLFEDPCGTRLEVNYVPGKGNLGESVSLLLAEEVQSRLSEPRRRSPARVGVSAL